MYPLLSSSRTRLCVARLIVVALLIAVSPAPAQLGIDFNTLQHGEIVTTQFVASLGMTVSANNPNRPFDLAIIFDSTRTGTADPDLEGPNWSRGNIPSGTVLGDMLILAENNVDTSPPNGLIDDPDDEGNRPAGDLIFSFNRQISIFGMDVVDIEGVMDENGMISFFQGATQLAVVNFSQFVTPGPFFDPTISFGDHSANRIRPITAAQLGITSFNRVVVRMGGSGALDNVLIPEPTVLPAAAIGLIALRRCRQVR
jgi:hypothetical protein